MRSTRTTTSIAVLVGIACVTLAVPAAADPIVWNGPSITFTKPDFADYTLAENQDRLTNHVWLTRLNGRPLFNIAIEDFPEIFMSPLDTEWAWGPTQPGNPGPITASNFANLEFTPFTLALNNAIGVYILDFGPGVVHLISDDIYLNIRFTAWKTGEQGSGGGFSYIRSTPGETPVPEPASLVLLGSGLVGIFGLRRRQRLVELAVTREAE